MESISSLGELALEASLPMPERRGLVSTTKKSAGNVKTSRALASSVLSNRVTDQGWIIERMVVAPRGLEAYDKFRAQAHSGLPRALLGRALQAPPACVYRGAKSSA